MLYVILTLLLAWLTFAAPILAIVTVPLWIILTIIKVIKAV